MILISLQGSLSINEQVIENMSLLSKSIFSVQDSGKLCLELVRNLTGNEVASIAPESLMHYGFIAS